MISRIRTAVCTGIEGRAAVVETEIFKGLPGISIVGLPSETVKESRERIRAAIINSGFDYPRTRIVVNLLPADVRKTGSSMDLPLAVGILAAADVFSIADPEETGFAGELSLDGSVSGVDGILPMIMSMYREGITRIVIPKENYTETSVVEGPEIFPVGSLTECVQVIRSGCKGRYSRSDMTKDPDCATSYKVDFADIRGQNNAKRAAVIAAAGRHGLLMIGPPGCGKSMIAKRIPTILPPMTADERLETAIIYSAAGKDNAGRIPFCERPFRNPGTTIGMAGLLGGGTHPVPGELTLAHNGILFLDEITEFERNKTEALRIPMEEKKITHFRQGRPYVFPCNFQLIMAANPCMCGFYGDPDRMCTCTQAQLDRYRQKLSGPILDRIDMKLTMEKVNYEEISESGCRGLSSDEMRNDVMSAVAFAKESGRTVPNADMDDKDIRKYCRLGSDEEQFMERAYNGLGLTPRSYKKVLRVARTIADIAGSEMIRTSHIAEALSYRMMQEVEDGQQNIQDR